MNQRTNPWEVTRLSDNVIRFTHQRGVFSLDFSRSRSFDLSLAPDAAFVEKAERAMADTEKGMTVNSSEGRMAGHFWLRNPGLAPEREISAAIEAAMAQCRATAKKVHDGLLANEAGKPFRYLAVIGIGGSQLGFQFIAKALGNDGFKLRPFSLDNTDPETVDSLLREIGPEHLDEVLFVVASKSGKTAEIRNGYRIFESIYAGRGLRFNKHVIAVTMEGSELYRHAAAEKWLDILPVWDWVGGRFSVLSPIGILPLALLGLDTESLLSGAGAMDQLTRRPCGENPAMLLVRYLLTQTVAGGKHNMVVLPYRDRLDLWGRFLQQLIMESLGKTLETGEGTKRFGLTVFGNKGTTDQHSYVQQLLAGPADFFALFLSVLREEGFVQEQAVGEGGVTMGDYLLAFCHGTMKAMETHGRDCMLITLDRLDAFSLGGLTALFERIVGYYAAYTGVNPYDQPLVEEGKKGADAVIQIKKKLNLLLAQAGSAKEGAVSADVRALAAAFAPGDYGLLYYLLRQMKEKGRITADERELDSLLK